MNSPPSAERLISLIDLTDLNDDSTATAVQRLCRTGSQHGVAGVCIWPDFVDVAVNELRSIAGAGDGQGVGIDVVTVVNFPGGDERPFAVAAVARRCIAAGADEIDVVLPYRQFAAGNRDRCAAVLDAVRDEVGEGRPMKVILETGELTDGALIRAAAEFAVDHGADFLKTSTGKSAVSATPEAFAVLVDVVAEADRPVGLKPSGGIRTRSDAERYVYLTESVLGEGWATPSTFRFGASGLLDDLINTA